MQRRISNLATNSILAQWVAAKDAEVAEASFFKINQAATPIDPTERRILQARKSPNAIAARAIVRAGGGHKYWAEFDPDIRLRIENLSRDLYRSLYEPPLEDSPIKTLDIPVAGRGYNVLPFIFDLVNVANDVNIPDSTKSKRIEDALPIDAYGNQTVAFLESVKRLVQRITGTHPASLGVHPAIYFYTRSGAFQPVSFLATAQFLEQLDAASALVEFTAHRRLFEDFLAANKDFVSLTIHKYGSGGRSLSWVRKIFFDVYQHIKSGKTVEETREAFFDDPEYFYLIQAKGPSPRAQESAGKTSGKMSTRTKSAIFLETATSNTTRCAICGAITHRNAMNIDHIQRRRDGGTADMSNAQITHPFCNSTVKN